MSNEVSGNAAMVGMALLEHQQQSVREGREARDAAHELGIASKKISTVFQGIARATEKFERTAAYIGAAVSVVGVAKSAAGVASAADTQASIDNITTQLQSTELSADQRTQLQGQLDQINESLKNPQSDVKGRIKEILKSTASEVFSITTQRTKELGESQTKQSETFDEVADTHFDLVDEAREMNEQSTELTQEMFKLGKLFKKVG